MIKKLSFLHLLIALMWAVVQPAAACGPTGLNIHATENVDGIANLPAAYISVSGAWQSDLSGAQGTRYGFTTPTDSLGHASVGDARVPAVWNFTEFKGPCNGQQTNNITVPAQGAVVDLVCYVTDDDFSANPNHWNDNLAPDVTVTGSGISLSALTYIVDTSGNVQYTATGAQSDTTVYLNTVSLYPGGNYYLVVTNPQSDGTYTPMGLVTLSIADCPNCP